MNRPPSFHDDTPPESASSSFPNDYELRVRGRLSQQAALWFEEMEIVIDESTRPPQTLLRGRIVDEAALYGLISRIRDLGLSLLSVARIQ